MNLDPARGHDVIIERPECLGTWIQPQGPDREAGRFGKSESGARSSSKGRKVWEIRIWPQILIERQARLGDLDPVRGPDREAVRFGNLDPVRPPLLLVPAVAMAGTGQRLRRRSLVCAQEGGLAVNVGVVSVRDGRRRERFSFLPSSLQFSRLCAFV